MPIPGTTPCGARKRDGSDCAQPAMPSGRCKMHGGRSLSGAAHPSFRHGRYSKNLPARLADRYRASCKDPDLLALRDDLALTDARLEDLLARVDTGESGELWASAGETMRAVRAARHSLDGARRSPDAAGRKVPEAEAHLTDTLDALELTIQGGVSDYAAWREVHAVLDQRRKLSLAEGKRLAAMQQMVTAEEALAMLGSVVDIIRRHVDDREALGAISRDIGRLVSVPAR